MQNGADDAGNEGLPALLTRAQRALASASTSAEFLEARRLAEAGFATAKTAARLLRAKGAHDEIVATCDRVAADMLLIKARAQIRLADEYDAAQERGEVQTAGGDRKSKINIPLENNDQPTVKNIGLTSKQVHEARKVRDAERKRPGVVKKALDAQIVVGKGVTEADVKRAVDEALSTPALKPKPPPRNDKEREQEERNARIIQLVDDGWTVADIAREAGLGERMVGRVLEIEKARRSSAVEAALPMSKRGEAALEREKRRLAAEFRVQVANEVRKRLEETILPHYNASYAKHQAVIKSRKGVMDKAEYNQFLFCLHPDRIANLEDNVLSRRFEVAFDKFQKLRHVLLSEKEDTTFFPPLPTSYEELMKARQAVMAKRRAQRETSKSALKPR